VKRYRGSDGGERLWLEAEEIEDIMANELQKAQLLPSIGAPAVNIEAFVDGHLKVHVDQYANLDASILGVTEFRRGAKPRISINRDLTEGAVDEEHSPAWMLGRWRATLAHEGSHVILHHCLFEIDPGQGELFSPEECGEGRIPQLQRCLKRDVSFGSAAGDWREVQANMGMAALLMPRKVFVEVGEREREELKIRPMGLGKGSVEAVRLAARLAVLFQVSQQAAAIRLDTVSMLGTEGVKMLL
jgi:hypothetical protein